MTKTQTLIAGDCRALLGELPADSISACITDPPYNYEFIGRDWNQFEIQRRMSRISNPSSKTLVKHIPYGSGLAGGTRNARWYERNRENILDYGKWVESWAKPLFRACKPGAYVAVFNSTRTAAHVQVALENVGFYARDCLVYRRPSGIPKGLNAARKLEKMGYDNVSEWEGWHSSLRNEWESITLVQKPLADNYITTLTEYGVGLMHTQMDSGAFASNILEGFYERSTDDFNTHCTPKPLPLMKYLIQLLLPSGDEHIVLDPFAGSGTTLVAAQELERSWIGMEIIQDYVNICERRISSSRQQGIQYSLS